VSAIAALALLGVGLIVVAGSRNGEASGAVPLFVYRGAGCGGRDRLPAFERFAGVEVQGVTDFIDFRSWDHFDRSVVWIADCWKRSKKALSLSIPMLVRDGSTLEQGARGDFDAHFARAAEVLVERGFGAAYLRLGLEFNGNWFPWKAEAAPEAYVAYFRRIAGIFRQAKGAHFKVVWNPNIGRMSIEPDRVYPGDEHVDVVAQDVYNPATPGRDETLEGRWGYVRSQPYGLVWLADFAKAHHKPMAFPEWGTGLRPDGFGGGDDPHFVRQMAAWIRQHDVAFHSYFDYRADYDSQISDGHFPKTAQAFVEEFGRIARAPASAQ
jgi:hypothetical protein